MNFDINVVAGLAAGVAAMVPGAIIYTPGVLGNQWMKSIGTTPAKVKAQGDGGMAVFKMLIVSLINGLVASFLVFSAGAQTFSDALIISMLLGWFWVSASMMLVFFENRNSTWFGISALSHLLTAGVIGIVLGLFV